MLRARPGATVDCRWRVDSHRERKVGTRARAGRGRGPARPLGADGLPAGRCAMSRILVASVRSRPDVARWVWRATSGYPRLLAAGVRVDGVTASRTPSSSSSATRDARQNPARRSRPGPAAERAGAARPAAQSRRAGLAGLPLRAAAHRRRPLQGPPGGVRGATAPPRPGRAPGRMRLLAPRVHQACWSPPRCTAPGCLAGRRAPRCCTASSARRYAGGGEPRRLRGAGQTKVSAAFSCQVRPDLPADVVRAFARAAGIRVRSTRRWGAGEIDTTRRSRRSWRTSCTGSGRRTAGPWLADWVRDGRFAGVPAGGLVSRRWTTNGGGALQIPKVIRQAVVADEELAARRRRRRPDGAAGAGAISHDPGLMEVAGHPTTSTPAVKPRLLGDRDHAKLALLGMIYGQTSGDGLKNLAALLAASRAPWPMWTDAAKAGEEEPLVRTWLGRTSRGRRGRGRGRGGRSAPSRGLEAPRAVRPGVRASDRRPGQGRFTELRRTGAAPPKLGPPAITGGAAAAPPRRCGPSWCSSSTTR